MPRVFLLVSLLFVLLAQGPTLRAAPALAGSYGCTGQNPGGESYTVALAIEPMADAFSLTWTFPDGGQGVGVGLVTGDVLSVVFATGTIVGVASYSIGPVTLTGTWTAPELYGLVQPEVCTRGGPAAPA